MKFWRSARAGALKAGARGGIKALAIAFAGFFAAGADIKPRLACFGHFGRLHALEHQGSGRLPCGRGPCYPKREDRRGSLEIELRRCRKTDRHCRKSPRPDASLTATGQLPNLLTAGLLACGSKRRSRDLPARMPGGVAVASPSGEIRGGYPPTVAGAALDWVCAFARAVSDSLFIFRAGRTVGFCLCLRLSPVNRRAARPPTGPDPCRLPRHQCFPI